MSLAESKSNYLGAEFIVSADTLKIIGTIDSSTPGEFLSPFFKSLHEQIVSSNVKKINIDITGLSYINSSSIKELVSWIIMQKSLPDDQEYMMNFICNSEYLWQDSSITTVSFLNPSKITKEVI
ncbi:MAG: hypothetical protein A2015_08025 [Spirochaetes bacterium GWF1_31_7]|nr:MAG: hypothetical protein A2Y30_02115 [Spirochaetes bacterium GWE1_32_154]OHD46987.1 MAG: hypothetical protein A2015_08025 [Spirochaetes bacterium GWF1_31_7]OHD49767.1 MAG: hypothetical protein A2Y29_06225 [Spirochaetes bacterium GWE2_31_10]OHD77826.1 MAG: hypothetical protein A2355_09295 [Spirochaetes bacterium RIFOXYB1_FULL_32_8]HBD95503.1 hypothetical protein [Spirochaetia bacterium]